MKVRMEATSCLLRVVLLVLVIVSPVDAHADTVPPLSKSSNRHGITNAVVSSSSSSSSLRQQSTTRATTSTTTTTTTQVIRILRALEFAEASNLSDKFQDASNNLQHQINHIQENVDWPLSSCCNPVQTLFLILFAVFFVINFLLWNTIIVKPMRLLAVFVHEMGHATMCWLTGGSVKAIQVFDNEGGVTKYVGGIRLCIIPAGYLGGALVGGIMVTMSGDRIASTVVVSILTVSLIISLCYAPNKVMVALSLAFVLLNTTLLFLEWFVYDPLIQFVCLYYGVFIGSFSCYDIYDDLITRTVEGSDAHACYKEIPCCWPRCVGVQFALVALVFQVAGVYFALVWMGERYGDGEGAGGV